ncbi:MAG: hypothetical protein KAG53_02735 [Endozoicomonadaceae bacterium]|nr:hypothetical protein [Endozoicomonadaceae bacterium]
MKKFIVIIISAIISHGCSTTYKKESNANDCGYINVQLSDNVFNVSFKGNSYTSRNTVNDFLLLRNAELALAYGFQYFTIIDTCDYTLNSNYVAPSITHTISSDYNYDHDYNNFFFDSENTETTGGQMFTISRPGASNTIACFNEMSETVFNHNAMFVYSKIRKKYGLAF